MGQKIMWFAVKLMGLLSYKRKFLLISMLFLIPMLVLSLMLLKNLTQATTVTRSEKAGIEYMRELSSLLSEITNRRGALHAFIRGDKSYAKNVKSYEEKIDEVFVALFAQDINSQLQLEVGERPMLLQKSWNQIKNTEFTSVKASFDGHQPLIDEINQLIRHLSISARLVSDPEVGTYQLASITLNRLPVLTTSITQLRRLAGDAALSRVLTKENAARFALKKEEVNATLGTLEFELETAYKSNNEIRSRIQHTATPVILAIRQYLHQLDRDIGGESISIAPTQCFTIGLNVVKKVESLEDTIAPALSHLLEVRLARQQYKEWFAYSIAMLFALGMVYLFVGFYLTIHQAVARVAEGAWAFASGNLSTRINLEVKDEMANVATSFNAMAGILEERAQRDELAQREAVQKTAKLREQLAKLGAHIENVASGDLSQRLSISGDDDLGRLADNLNAMTESLAEVATGTTEAINTISSAVEELQCSINGQSSGASEQAAAVNETTAALDQIKGMAAQAMERVQMLGETAERSRRESELGGVAVEQAISGMAGILHRMEGIAQTILALSEQIQQIGEITGVVTNLAQQSKMLALNASIEAAKAGEAGKGFAVVAAEVRELAEQSQQSTAQVQKILQDIRHATDRAVMATEEGSKGVDAGMLSVQRSGDVMRQLNEVVRETAIASQQITAVVKQQFIGLEQVTNAMKDINKVTAQFVSSTQQSQVSSAGISKVTDRLRDSVKAYKL